MKLFYIKLVCFIILNFGINVYAEAYFYEDFKNLNSWEELHFKKISKHSNYKTTTVNKFSVLQASSNSSASAIVLKEKFNVYDNPLVIWRWTIEDTYKNLNHREKSGDDYPLRFYILFEYDPEQASYFTRAKYSLTKMIYGEYPPYSSLNYVWTNSRFTDLFYDNPYTSRAKMKIIESGKSKKGKRWRVEKINIINDYQKAFNESPPKLGTLAVMSDSDNSLLSGKGYIDYIKICNNSFSGC